MILEVVFMKEENYFHPIVFNIISDLDNMIKKSPCYRK